MSRNIDHHQMNISLWHIIFDQLQEARNWPCEGTFGDMTHQWDQISLLEAPYEHFTGEVLRIAAGIRQIHEMTCILVLFNPDAEGREAPGVHGSFLGLHIFWSPNNSPLTPEPKQSRSNQVTSRLPTAQALPMFFVPCPWSFSFNLATLFHCPFQHFSSTTLIADHWSSPLICWVSPNLELEMAIDPILVVVIPHWLIHIQSPNGFATQASQWGPRERRAAALRPLEASARWPGDLRTSWWFQ